MNEDIKNQQNNIKDSGLSKGESDIQSKPQQVDEKANIPTESISNIKTGYPNNLERNYKNDFGLAGSLSRMAMPEQRLSGVIESMRRSALPERYLPGITESILNSISPIRNLYGFNEVVRRSTFPEKYLTGIAESVLKNISPLSNLYGINESIRKSALPEKYLSGITESMIRNVLPKSYHSELSESMFKMTQFKNLAAQTNAISTILKNDNSEMSSIVRENMDFEENQKLREKLIELEKKYIELQKVTTQEKTDEIERIKEDYNTTNQLLFLETKIHNIAYSKVKNEPVFFALFKDSTSMPTVVVSIDIRKSTELMLKAKTPQLYSDFIVSLSEKLKSTIINNFGIFDKFTGDGILAFFPAFYSGKDNLLCALKAAELCHSVFIDHYHSHRNVFSVVYSDIGLGIGVDFGDATLTKVGGDLTVVGHPVVYACRLSSAPANHTFLNQNAQDELIKRYGKNVKFQEHILNIKNEGNAIVYQSFIDWEEIQPSNPDWYKIE